MLRILCILLLLTHYLTLNAQESALKNCCLVTFGNMSKGDCIDDDFSQTIFFAIPDSSTGEFYIRVLDPDCGGEMDKACGLWETNTIFEIYGGTGCLSDNDSRLTDPVGNYKAGILLSKAIFARESLLDGKWYSFGPFKIKSGEQIKNYPGYHFFKAIVESHTGDDANVYTFFISSKPDENVQISDADFFSYEGVYVQGGIFEISRNTSKKTNDERIEIPISLKKIREHKELDIIAEPIGD